MTHAPAIGVIGLGNIGGGIAQRLRDQGLALTVFDLRADAIAPFERSGAAVAADAAELAARSDVVIVALPSVEASLAVAEEVADTGRPRAYVETSTLGMRAIREIADLVGHDRLVDAPVSGGADAARSGRLAMFIGGRPPAIEAARATLACIADPVVVVGAAPGAGQTVKLVNNAVSLSAMLISSEAVAVGVAAGIEPSLLLECLNAGTARNSATEAKLPRHVLTGSFDYGGPVSLAEKDLQLYAELAAAVGIDDVSVVARSLRAIRAVAQTYGASADYAEMARLFEDATGVPIRTASRKEHKNDVHRS